ncbi:MAG: hypothetical protein JWN31_1838 [Frankiales bacterium]|nr:hypothetical protein [Frankiales bacterium]
MNDDELHNRLARLDPQADAPVNPITSPWAQDLLERSMTTTETASHSPAMPPRNRRPLALAAAGLVAVAGIATAVVMNQDGGSSSPTAKKSTLVLSAPAAVHPGRPGVGSSCIRFDVELLKAEPVAFAGTVTAIQPGSVTLDVTKWFKGGTADQVTVTTHDNSTVALDGVDFVQGKDFLVSANEGTVVACGYSGPEDPTLRQAYEQAFS